MTGYIVLFFFIILFCISKSLKVKCLGTLATLIGFSAFRYGIGYDYYMYLQYITGEYVRYMEPLPQFLAILSRNTSPYLFFVLTSIIINLLFIISLKHISIKDHKYDMRFLWYFGFPYLFFSSLGLIRQFLAYSFIFYAICYFYNQRWKQLFCIIIASLCHTSAIICIIYLLPLQKINRVILWISFLFSFVMGEFLIKGIAEINSNLYAYARLQEYIGLEGMYSGGTYLKFLIYTFSFLTLLKYDKIVNKNPDYKYYVSAAIIGAVFCALFSVSAPISKRICTFFFMSSLVFIPSFYSVYRIKLRHSFIISITLFIMYAYVQHVTTLNDRPPYDLRGYSSVYPYRTIFSL